MKNRWLQKVPACPAAVSYGAAGFLAGGVVTVAGAAPAALSGGPSAGWLHEPSLWPAALLPVLLGVLGGLAGRRSDRTDRRRRAAEDDLEGRTAENERLRDELDRLTEEHRKNESVLRLLQDDNLRFQGELEDARRRLDEAVAQAQVLASDAGTAARARDEFLSSVSHELRTPLNGIIGMADLALGSRDEKERAECLETIKMCGHSLLHLVSDILEYSRINAGKVVLEPVNFILPKIVDDAVSIARNTEPHKDLAFRCFYDPAIAEEYVGDPIRLRQILINLLGNAVKFTESGVVEVRVTRSHDDPVPESRIAESPVKLRFAVSDTGIGIPADKLETIFDEFTQADNSLSRRYEGSGLGLTIAKNLVELMEGEIWVESTEQRGSTFFFTVVLDAAVDLPLRPRREGRSGDGSDRALRILVADDNVISQIVITRLLKAAGHKLMFADEAEEVVSFLEDRKFDLVFMGIHLPDMNGMEATALIRRKEAERGVYTPIVGLVSDDEKDERRWCLKAGMDGVVLKPIDQRALNKTMEQVLEAPDRNSLHAAGRAVPAPPPEPAATAPDRTTDR